MRLKCVLIPYTPGHEANELLHSRLEEFTTQLAVAHDRIRELEASDLSKTAALEQARIDAVGMGTLLFIMAPGNLLMMRTEARIVEDKAKIKTLHSEHSDALVACAQAEDKLAHLSEKYAGSPFIT